MNYIDTPEFKQKRPLFDKGSYLNLIMENEAKRFGFRVPERFSKEWFVTFDGWIAAIYGIKH